jgi:L-ascorbate metabolism protein UlaG (beta-lactamase superfamily)
MGRISGLAVCAVVAIVCLVAAAEDRLPVNGGELAIRPLAHASVALEFQGRVIYVDPWSGADLSSAPQSDLILVTDADAGAHHLDVTALQRLRRTGGTVVIPAAAKAKVPDGTVMDNGASRRFGNVIVDAIPSYDIRPGEPFHAKGTANGYLLTIGAKRVYFAGVTECVPEIQRLKNVDVAFLPMNSPNGRMTPAAVADCVRTFRPAIVYPYHYDQGYIARRAGRGGGDGADAASSVRTLAESLKGVAEVRMADWYPAR